MTPDIEGQRRQAHDFLDRLPPAQVPAVRGLLEAMLAPADDEPVTAEGRRRFHEGQAWFTERGGRGVPMEDVLADFGLAPEDFPLDK
jgi:hypothetical protein